MKRTRGFKNQIAKVETKRLPSRDRGSKVGKKQRNLFGSFVTRIDAKKVNLQSEWKDIDYSRRNIDDEEGPSTRNGNDDVNDDDNDDVDHENDDNNVQRDDDDDDYADDDDDDYIDDDEKSGCFRGAVKWPILKLAENNSILLSV